MPKPNVVVIVPHDLGRYLGCYGHLSSPSPALDQLAADGVRYDRAFAHACFCSPSRGSLITGKYPHVNGLMGLVNLGWDLPAANRTDAQIMKQAGYRTGLFGLQHEVKDCARLGFDHVSDRGLGHRCDVVAGLFEQFMESREGADGQPFYARVGFSQCHRPFPIETAEDPDSVAVPGYLPDLPGTREDLTHLHVSVREMDAAVGRIVESIDRAGLGRETLIVFTTDHGLAMPWAKGTLYDAGTGVSLIMRWTGTIEAGRVASDMVGHIDFLPTLMDLVGLEPDPAMDGRSYLPLLLGEAGGCGRDRLFAEKNSLGGDLKRCVRTPTHKYIVNVEPGPQQVLPTDVEISYTRRDMGNDHLAPRPPVELYDLTADPHERHNLAGDPAAADVEAGLRTDLEQWRTDTRDPALTGPVSRPEEEIAFRERVAERIARTTPYPRDGLRHGLAAL